MNVKPDLRSVATALVLLLVLVMCNQLQVEVPLGPVRLPVTLADVVLLLALAGVLLQLGARKLRVVRLPPVQAFVLVAAALAALARTPSKLDGAKEVAQLIEYFLVAYFVFVNSAGTRDLKPLLSVFGVATGLTVVWAAADYVGCRSAFHVAAGYENRNALGAFLALTLPMLYGVALYARSWPLRIGLLALVALGLVVNLSGGAVLVTVAVLGVLSALHGRRALTAYLAVSGVALLLAPRCLPRAYHTDALFSSAAPYVDDNFLLDDGLMLAAAEEFFHPQKEIVLDRSGAKGIPAPRPLDADRLLRLLHRRRPLGPEEERLQIEVKTAVETQLPAELRQSYPLEKPQVAVRYQRWNAEIACARNLWDKGAASALLGLGLERYHTLVKEFMPDRLQYRTNLPEVYNVAAPEEFTFNIWLKTFIQQGLIGFLALAWLVGAFLSRGLALWRAAHSELVLGVALGSVGSILGFALGGVFTENIARGLAIPLVFILALITIGERIVYGERKSPLEQLTRYD